MPVIALQSHDLHRKTPTHHGFPFTLGPDETAESVDVDSTPTSLDSPPAPRPSAQTTSHTTPPSPLSRIAPSTSPSFVPRHFGSQDDLATAEVVNGGEAHESEAGPSHQRQSSIPPPASARRHRSGVLMSQARSRAASGGFRGGNGVVGSKSFGDLSLGLTMSSADVRDGDGEVEVLAGKEFRRITSDGYRRSSGDADDQVWDNSARFYHHLHTTSRPVSRQTSPDRSQSLHSTPGREVSPVRTSSTSASPIHVRRSQILPQNGPGPPLSIPPHSSHSAHSPSTALSPAHAFLQSHLPPLFPSPGGSPEHPSSHSMVILTPTTAEWKELKKEMGEELSRVDSSGSSDGRSGSAETQSSSSSDGTGREQGLMLDRGSVPPSIKRPSLQSTMSADYLQRERQHTPDPGSFSPPDQNHAFLSTPIRPIFHQNVIAPSPTVPHSAQALPDHPDIADLDQDQPIVFDTNSAGVNQENDDSPQRFASIGRRESLRAVPKLQEPKQKTKRELERERLFRDLDEELEADKGSGKVFETVQQIGSGLKLSESGRIIPVPLESAGLSGSSGLGSGSFSGSLSGVFNPPSAGSEVDERKSNPGPQPNSGPTRSVGSASISTASISPSIPFKPSPLHGSPLLAMDRLVSPEESPELDPATNPRPTLNISAHTANLETIRDYARSLADPKEPTMEISDPLSPAPSPKSRRPTHRRRDTKRVSLVAGRIVQPFTVPPDTSLPPGHGYFAHGDGSMSPMAKKASLNSFSPFRTPNLTPSTSIEPSAAGGSLAPLGVGKHGAAFPGFNRMDSTISVAPSIGPPSEPGTPSSETAGGVGGRGIDDYVILSEAGKGAYGLVMRAKVKGVGGEAEGEEVIIKYIVKVRILADCWKKHKVLGPIPVEIHVMDQLRHLLYNAPSKPHPWDPSRLRPTFHTDDPASESEMPTPLSGAATPTDSTGSKRPTLSALPQAEPRTASTPESAKSSPRSFSSNMFSSHAQRYIASELRVSPGRGHPNICKLLDFFEDREFYYMVMPRFGSGLDLFDRVEASPNGLAAFDVRSLIGQLADAVRFLHSNGIVHRDIKDENVILDGEGRCQLIDFGSSAHWRPGKRWDTFSGTLHYASPEILRGDYYGGKEQDVYALGTVMYVLLVGETPFAELPDEVLVGLVEGSRGLEALQERCTPDVEGLGEGEGEEGGVEAKDGEEEDGGGKLSDAEDLVRRCLEMEIADRPTAEMLCNHKFLKGREGWAGYRGWVKVK